MTTPVTPATKWRHLFAVLGALVLLAFAAIVVWSNRHALGTTHLVFSGACIALAFALAIPADFDQACAKLAPYLPIIRGSGGTP